jgi:hypothetical protein
MSTTGAHSVDIAPSSAGRALRCGPSVGLPVFIRLTEISRCGSAQQNILEYPYANPNNKVGLLENDLGIYAAYVMTDVDKPVRG